MVATLPVTLRTFCAAQAERLLADGWRVTWACADDGRIGAEVPSCVRYIPIPFKRGLSPFQLPLRTAQLHRLFRRERFDIVQYATPNAVLCAGTASWLARTPVRLYNQWGILYVYFNGMTRWLYKTYERWSCYCSTVVQPDSLSNLEFCVKEGLYPKGKGYVVWNGSARGVDLKTFNFSRKAAWRLEYRKRMGLEPHHLVIGFVGSIRREKGCNELLAACRGFFGDMPSARLLLIGDKDYYGSVRPDLRGWADSSPQVKYVPPNAEIPQYMACMDVLALPSYQEGFGAAVVEAEAMGVPVVVTEYPGPVDAVRHKVTGLIVPMKNAAALAAALRGLLVDDGRREKLGAAAVQFVRENFDQQELMRRIVADRNQLVARARGSAPMHGAAEGEV